MNLQNAVFFIIYSLAVLIASMIWTRANENLRNEKAVPHAFSIHCASLAWILTALFKSDIVDFLGSKPMDEIVHIERGNEIASGMSSGLWGSADGGVILGNEAFQYFLGITSYVFDSRDGFASLLIISFLCFYGSMRLVIYFIAQTGLDRSRSVFSLFAMASPSLLFWGISNLKEGIMYWSVCMTIIKSMELLGERDVSRGKMSSYFILSLAALVGCILRPYVMIIWLTSLSYLLLFSRYRLFVVPAFVAFMMAALFALDQMSGFGSSVETTLGLLDGNHESIVALDGSSIQGPRIFFISGIVAMFFRPFIWSASGIQQVLSSLETWSIALFLAYQVAKNKGRIFGVMAKNRKFISCVLALVGFCILFTWSGNEGLLVRQRVQVFPALVFIGMHFLSMSEIQKKMKIENG